MSLDSASLDQCDCRQDQVRCDGATKDRQNGPGDHLEGAPAGEPCVRGGIDCRQKSKPQERRGKNQQSEDRHCDGMAIHLFMAAEHLFFVELCCNPTRFSREFQGGKGGKRGAIEARARGSSAAISQGFK